MGKQEFEWIIYPKYDEIIYSGADSKIVVINHKVGFINKGIEVVSPMYEFPNSYGGDRFMFATSLNPKGKMGVIDIEGQIRLPFEYDDIRVVEEKGDIGRVTKDKKHGFINDKCEFITDLIYDAFDYCFHSKNYKNISDTFIKVKRDGK